MTTDVNTEAVAWADHLLEQLVKHQPELCNFKGHLDKSKGEDTAAHLTALRNGLIAMYTAQPHR